MNGWVVVPRTRIYQFQNPHLKGIIGHPRRGFLTGVELATKESLQRFPLKKRSLFSLIKGGIEPIVYTINDKDGGSGGGTSNDNGNNNNKSNNSPSGGGAKKSGGESTIKDGKEGKENNEGKGKKESKEEKKISDEKMKKEVTSKPSVVTNAMHQAAQVAQTSAKSVQEKKLEVRPAVMHMSSYGLGMGSFPGSRSINGVCTEVNLSSAWWWWCRNHDSR